MKRSMRKATFLWLTGEESEPSYFGHPANNARNSPFIQHRIFYNAFAFPSLTYEFHWKSGHTPDDLKAEESGSIGVWIFASHINHSCYPLVRRTYIGDMMIFRAQADIPADTELKFGYISCLESYKARQKMLKKWGFRCECQVCFAEKEYSQKMVRKRAKITEEIIERFERSTATDLGVYGHCSSHGFTSWI